MILFQDGQAFSFEDGSLEFASWKEINGLDTIGAYSGFETSWNLPDFKTSFRIYDGNQIVVFKQRFICAEVISAILIQPNRAK